MPKQSTSNRGRWPSLANSDQGTMEDWISLIKSWGTLCSGNPESYEMLFCYPLFQNSFTNLHNCFFVTKELILNDFFKYQSKENGMNLSRMHPESFQDFSRNCLGLLKDGISSNPERISELLGSSVSQIPA